MNTSILSLPVEAAIPVGTQVGVFGSMATLVGVLVAGAALVCAAVAGVLMLFLRIIARTPEALVSSETGEVLPASPFISDSSDLARSRLRPVLRAALIWACGGVVLAVIGAIVTDPMLVYPALSALIAAGILLVIVAAGYRLAGVRDHKGIHLKHLIYTGTITVAVAATVLVLLSLIFTSPAVTAASLELAVAS